MKKIIMIRPPEFQTPSYGKLKPKKKGSLKLEKLIKILKKEEGKIIMFSSMKESSIGTAQIVSKGIDVPFFTIKELLCGNYLPYDTGTAFNLINQESNQIEAETVIIITGVELCLHLPVYAVNFLKGTGKKFLDKIPNPLRKGEMSIIDIEEETISVY